MTEQPTDLRGVDEADVYKGGRLAATLVRRGSDVVFAYDPDYLSDPASEQVAFTLPRSAEPRVSSGDAVPPYFAGLMPEGVRLRSVVTATRTSEDDHLTVLLAVGADAIGDIAVVPAGSGPPELAEPAVDPSAAIDLDLRAVFERATSTDLDELDRAALPGVQPKVSAAMMSTPVGTTAGPAILKLEPATGYPQLVENEDFFLRMAAACGLDVPEHSMITDRAGRRGLLVRRFDRSVTPEGIRRWPQEDGCQVLDRYPAAKYRVKTESVIARLAACVDSAGGSPALVVRSMIELVAFSYLIGNGDLHAKNMSITSPDGGLWSATPAYDLVSTQPYLSWADPMAMTFYGRANRLDRAHLTTAAERLGVAPRATAVILDRLVDAGRDWARRVGEIGFDDQTSTRLETMIVERAEELAR